MKSVKEERKEQQQQQQQKELLKWTKKVKVTKQEGSPRARNITQSKLNSFPNTNIFSGDRPRRASRIDSSHGTNFTITKEELKAFLGINFFMALKKLPTISEYWTVDNLIVNDSI